MSIFSVKKTVVVSSVVYNMAGPEEDRPNFLKTVMLGNALNRGNNSIGESVVDNYIGGPGLKLRSFYRWASNHYDAVGIPTDSFTSTKTLDVADVTTAISTALSRPVKVDWVEMGFADATYWAIQWIYDNHPDMGDDEWVADFDIDTSEITITFVDTMISPVTITITGYDYGHRYIYASYIEQSSVTTGPVVSGSVTTLAPGEAFPSTSGWSSAGSTTTGMSADLHTTVVTTVSYSDGRPNVVTTAVTTTPTAYDRYVGHFERTLYNGISGGVRRSTNEFMTLVQDKTISSSVGTTSSSVVVSGVTETTTVVTTTEALDTVRTVQIDTQIVYHSVWSDPTLFIYKEGSGDTLLDAMFVEDAHGDGYYPIIPLRLNNHFISDSFEPTLYTQSKKAYKKVFNADYDEMIANLNDNPSLSNLDFAYIVFGVNMNTKEKEGIQYIYEYFKRLMGEVTLSGPTDMDNWTGTVYSDYVTTRTDYEDWLEEQIDIGTAGVGTYTTEPTYPTYQAPPVTEVRIKTNSSVINYDMQLDWDTIVEVTGTGEGRVGARAGDLWIAGEANDDYDYLRILGRTTEKQNYKNQVLKVWWQVTDTTWKRLDIKGLVNRNRVWKGKSVNTWAVEAIADEDESQFIVPLHYEVFKKLPLKVSTQLSTSCAHMLINVYEIHKEHWYERGIFKVFLFIAAVVLTVLFPPAGLAIFASAVGVSLITAAAIFVGLNMIAAMILMKIITPLAVAIFGEKVGQIVAAVATFVVTAGLNVFNSTGSFVGTLQVITSPINLLYLTSSIGNGISGMVQAEAMDLAHKTQELMGQYESQLKDLAAKYKDVFGEGFSYIDPISLTNSPLYGYESSETFLSRTLMTGSDIAELTQALLNSFAEITLRLDLPS